MVTIYTVGNAFCNVDGDGPRFILQGPKPHVCVYHVVLKCGFVLSKCGDGRTRYDLSLCALYRQQNKCKE